MSNEIGQITMKVKLNTAGLDETMKSIEELHILLNGIGDTAELLRNQLKCASSLARKLAQGGAMVIATVDD